MRTTEDRPTRRVVTDGLWFVFLQASACAIFWTGAADIHWTVSIVGYWLSLLAFGALIGACRAFREAITRAKAGSL